MARFEPGASPYVSTQTACQRTGTNLPQAENHYMAGRPVSPSIMILPGFMMLCGSSAVLMACMTKERRLAMLAAEVFNLALADGVLAG